MYIVTIPKPDDYPEVPGALYSACLDCEEIRINYPDDLADPWKRHGDYCPTEE